MPRSLRVGPVGSDGLIMREESVKVAGAYTGQLQWVELSTRVILCCGSSSA